MVNQMDITETSPDLSELGYRDLIGYNTRDEMSFRMSDSTTYRKKDVKDAQKPLRSTLGKQGQSQTITDLTWPRTDIHRIQNTNNRPSQTTKAV